MNYILENNYGYYAGKNKNHQKVFHMVADTKSAKRFSTKERAEKKVKALQKAGWDFHIVEGKSEKRVCYKVK